MPEIIGATAEPWCIKKICEKFNINCNENINITAITREHFCPKELRDQFTIWGAVALEFFGFEHTEAMEIETCSQLMFLYYTSLASKTKNTVQIEALKLVSDSGISTDIALSINDTKSLNKLRNVISHLNFIQTQALNTNKLENISDAYKFSTLLQVEALKFDNITVSEALNITSLIQLKGLTFAPYIIATYLENEYQLAALKLGIDNNLALKFNSSHQIEALKEILSIDCKVLVALMALHLNKNKLGKFYDTVSLYNSIINASQNIYFQPCKYNISIHNQLDKSITSRTLEFDSPIQAKAFELGVTKISSLTQFNNEYQIKALQAGLSIEQSLTIINNFQATAAIDYKIPYPIFLKYGVIQIAALKTGKIKNTKDALKFDNIRQTHALKHDNVTINQALKFTNLTQLTALKDFNVTPDLAVKFISDKQINALKNGMTPEQAVKTNFFKSLLFNFSIEPFINFIQYTVVVAQLVLAVRKGHKFITTKIYPN